MMISIKIGAGEAIDKLPEQKNYFIGARFEFS